MSLPFTIHSPLGGEAEVLWAVPENVDYKRLADADTVAFVHGPWGHMIFQEKKGNGFSAWDSQYEVREKTELRARTVLPIRELHTAVTREVIDHRWNCTALGRAANTAGGFTHTDEVDSTATLNAYTRYHTFDYHFDLNFLESYADAYPKLASVLNESAHERVERVSA
jgi:hypothetical protein